MDLDDLAASVRLMAEENLPDRERVLHRVAKLRARRRRLMRGVFSAGALAIAGVCVVGVVHVLQPGTGAPTGTGPSGTSSSGSQSGLAGCAPLSFGLRRLVSNGQTLAEATGRLTGRTRTIAGLRYAEMNLAELRVLAGASLRTTSPVWLQSAPNPSPSDVPGLWAMNGRLIAIVTPQKVAQTPIGPVARVAPLLGNRAVLNATGCWDDSTLHGEPLSERPFREVPGTSAYNLAVKFGGFSTVPVTTLVEATH